MRFQKNRWIIAQSYEKNWWSERNNTIDMEFYERFALELLEFSKNLIKIDKKTTILEIGSGACGVLTHLTNTTHRFALDPLEKFYSKVKYFTDHRDNSVKYITAKGENIPIKSGLIDLIIMDNVLDHCEEPSNIIVEIKRVMSKNSILYFKQNTYHFWGKFIRLLMEKIIIDRGHPHTFSKKDLQKLFQLYGFEILKSKRTGYLNMLKREISSSSWKDKIKATLLVTRDKVTYLLTLVDDSRITVISN